jgi:hypothetical protein
MATRARSWGVARTRPGHRHLVGEWRSGFPVAYCNSAISLTALLESRGLTNFGFGEDACERCVARTPGLDREIDVARAASEAKLTKFSERDPFELLREATIPNAESDLFDFGDEEATEDPWVDDDPEFDPFAKGAVPAPAKPPEAPAPAAPAPAAPVEPEPTLPWEPPGALEPGTYESVSVARAGELAPVAVYYPNGSPETLLAVIELIPRSMGLVQMTMADGQGFRARPTDMIFRVVKAPEEDLDSGVGDRRPDGDRDSDLVPQLPSASEEKEERPMTTVVTKGTNRPAAAARTRKAAQRTPLPPKGSTGDAEKMQAVIEEAVAEVTATPARKRAAKKALKVALDSVAAETKAADPVAVKKPTKAAAKKMAAEVAAVEKGLEDVVKADPKRKTEPSTPGQTKTAAKAARFIAELEELDAGWSPITPSAFSGDLQTVVAKRAEGERIEISWNAGVYVPGSGKYVAGGRERVLRNASDILKNWAPKKTSELQPKRPAGKAKPATKGA